MYRCKEIGVDEFDNGEMWKIYKIFLPEISSILEIPLSSIEQYPEELKKDLCHTYINHYRSDSATLQQSLAKVIELFYQPPKQKFSAKGIISQTAKKLSEHSLIKTIETTQGERSIVKG